MPLRRTAVMKLASLGVKAEFKLDRVGTKVLLRTKKPYKVVIRGLPNFDPKLIEAEIKNRYKLAPTAVFRMTRRNENVKKYPDCLFLVHFQKGTVTLNALKAIRSINSIIVRWKPYRGGRHDVTQYQRCLNFGVVDESETAKCAKCDDSHQRSDKQCPKREDFKRIRKQASTRNQSGRKKDNTPVFRVEDFPPLRATQHGQANPRVQPGPRQETSAQNVNPDLFSADELMKIFVDMTSALRICRSKPEQIQVHDSVSIPRWVAFCTDLASIQIHGFCDASKKAYGACLYFRSTTFSGSVEVRLITAKSKRKGKKREQTTPRLELSGALLLSHLYEKIVSSTGIHHTAHFWTDSTIMMYWLSSLPSRWQMFVANRVSEIQHITKGSSWKHVAGAANLADIISRGMIPAQLQYEKLWFEGPLWLRQDASIWPSNVPEEEVDQALLEERKIVALPATSDPVSEIFSLRSSLFILVRLIARIRRFVHDTQHRDERRIAFLSYPEHEEAIAVLVRLAQRESFPMEFAALEKGKSISPSSKLNKLNPIFIDGVFSVGGRLAKAPVSASRKHPIILCHRHPLAKVVLDYYHRKNFHSGMQLLVSTVRERFWVTRIRSLANTVIHECVQCFRNRPKVLDQLMADRPSERVSPVPPFLNIPRKHFVAIFVCLVTKAVHLELVSDLTSEAFLAAFKRFVARRGRPALVMCDNALNFVGAKCQLDELRQLFMDQGFHDSVARGAVEEGIEFCFIPARSPNFGGLWEAAVKSFKGHFKRTISDRLLQHDEMSTVLPQIEAILNSRPLTPISNDPSDFEALTPGHFLVQRPLTAIAEPLLESIQHNRLSMWQRAQDYVQQIWKKWCVQYLSDLHNRTKWTRKRDNISIGTSILLKEDNLPPLKWKLGRVVDIHAGSDGNIRVVTVKTQNGLYRRAISKICILPIRDNNFDLSASEQN
ncbi:uncharacterized protein LOC135699964 [Ochlerotatus camptorhynchus]|uniref:uncharacterized protein LOC135699964 n=1 Tax=Ochlerotatus camptorhynchus TaxID=644619 RepID=UPI0031DC73F3